MQTNLQEILMCPICGKKSIQLDKLQCKTCKSFFFELNGIPCLFPSGIKQLQLWNHLLAKFIEEGSNITNALTEELNKHGISSVTKQRLAATLNIHNISHDYLVKTLQQVGLHPKNNADYKDYSTKVFSKYHQLPLRDWAWFSESAVRFSYGDLLHDENQLALNHIIKLLNTVKNKAQVNCRTLVIGAGAGRLSWDIHCLMQPSMTIAMDFNPLLSYLSKSLIRDKNTVKWHEKIDFPFEQLPTFHEWQLKCPETNAELHQSWIPILADAYAMPFVPHTFDYVVTPWFIDVMSIDCKKLIFLIDKMLKPSGYWINYGPFLYNEKIPESEKYTSEEIKELLRLSHFQVISEATFQTPYSCSPLNKCGRIEQVWGMVAQSPSDRTHMKGQFQSFEPIHSQQPPPWFVMPHLPIPRLMSTKIIPEALTNIAELIDGTRSVNEIAALLASHLPEGYNSEDVLYDFLLEYFF